MFLGDELLEIGRNTQLDKNSIIITIDKMIKICFANLIKGLGGREDVPAVLANFKRVNKTWEIVAEKLKKEGRGFIRKDGFKNLVKLDKGLNGLLT